MKKTLYWVSSVKLYPGGFECIRVHIFGSLSALRRPNNHSKKCETEHLHREGVCTKDSNCLGVCKCRTFQVITATSVKNRHHCFECSGSSRCEKGQGKKINSSWTIVLICFFLLASLFSEAFINLQK